MLTGVFYLEGAAFGTDEGLPREALWVSPRRR